jgi:hypothetical protein
MTNKIKRFMLIVAFTMIPAWVAITPNPSFAQEFEWWFWKTNYVKEIDTVWASKAEKNDDLIKSIQRAINWALWLLAAVALCLVIYAWFLMLTSGWDSKKYDQWLSIIKNAAIWLVIIGVSWLIVSLIFYVINWATSNSGGGGGGE